VSFSPPAAGPTTPASTPPGWYPDPTGGYGQRYWDGMVWTANVAPAYGPPGPKKSDAKSGDWIGGVLLALLIPIVGVIAGIVYLTRGGTKRQVGAMTLALSLISVAGWVALTSAG
jgi:hypothetical protein